MSLAYVVSWINILYCPSMWKTAVNENESEIRTNIQTERRQCAASQTHAAVYSTDTGNENSVLQGKVPATVPNQHMANVDMISMIYIQR